MITLDRLTDVRCAVLRVWDPVSNNPIIPVAAIAWHEGATLSQSVIRWMPTLTYQDETDQDAWRSRYYLADRDLLVADWLTHHTETTPTVDVVTCTVPAGSRTLGGVADLLLDEVLASPAADYLDDIWYPTKYATAGV